MFIQEKNSFSFAKILHLHPEICAGENSERKQWCLDFEVIIE